MLPRNAMKFYGDYQVYSESGVDLTLLRENLKRTFEERLAQNGRAVHLAEALRKSGLPSTGKGPEIRGKELMADFDPAALLRHLAGGQVEFVLIGGLAMIAQGSASTTKDLDICYSRSPKNMAALATTLAPLHPYLRGAPPGLPFHFDAATIQAGLNFTLTTDLGDIDFLGEVSGVGGYEQALAQSQERNVFGLAIRVLSLEGLIAAKKAAGRVKDRLHLLELEELKKLRDAQP
jgi:hypothetical protein